MGTSVTLFKRLRPIDEDIHDSVNFILKERKKYTMAKEKKVMILEIWTKGRGTVLFF